MPDQCPYPRQWSFRDYPGKVKCLSDEWFAMMNHAVAEASRLGINMSVFMSPGWSHCGGPWVRPEMGLKKLAATRITVSGPANLSVVLDKPPLSIGRGGGNEIPKWNKDAARLPQPRENFYRDEAVLAVPDPGPGKAVPLRRVLNLTSRLDAQGRLEWQAPAGNWTVWRLALVSENGLNHPAPVDGMGLECDRMDPAAVRAVFDGMVGRIHREAEAKGYHSFKRFETDSYEGGYQDFGLDFRAQFERRRGYDCTPWLPAWINKRLTISSGELSQRFRTDMLRTISELWVERFHGTLRQLADEHGLEWMSEPYWGINLDWRTVGGQTTMPGSEFWAGQDKLTGTAPEIAAIYGQKVVWAEAFTAESYDSAWRNDPWSLKPYGDAAFCRGINHFFMHGFVHNPFPDDYQPGLTMGYWGTQLSRHVTWWSYSLSWHEYLARCQYMLRQGVPVNDVLVYPPRSVGDAEVFFVSHQSDGKSLVEASFRVNGLQPEWWDPLNGSRRNLPDFRFEQGRTIVPLGLAPRQSGFVVFRKPSTAGNLGAQENFPPATSAMTLEGAWEVSFDPRWGGPKQITFEQLQDWARHPNPGIRYYSGTAAYRKTFDFTPPATHSSPLFLDLGTVMNLARVRLNGRDLGIVWCAPWRVGIPAGVLKEKGNALEIEVVNTWVNRLIGDEQEPEDCELEPGNPTGKRLGSYHVDVPSRGLKDLPDWFVNRQPCSSSNRYTFTTWRFYDKAAPLQPSGLLGPVRLLAHE